MVVGGDFNAPHQAWGYSRDTAKGRDLMREATEQGYTLITDHKQPTRTAPTSTQRDSTPDLTFVKNVYRGIHVAQHRGRPGERPLHTGDRAEERRGTQNRTQMDRLGRLPSAEKKRPGTDGHRRHRSLDDRAKEGDTATNESVPCVDSRLAHLIDARKSIKERWKKQRWNRKLRKKVTELNRSIEKHSALLCRQQWDKVCNRIDGSLQQSKAWSLIRHLLDETKTKSYQQNRMAQVMHEAEKSLGKEELIKKLKTKYMPQTETEKHPGYAGAPNEKLDREITTRELTQAIRELNSRSAAGPDGISNKALRNLDDSSIEVLTKYYNKCWQSGKLPMQWKTVRTVLIPKPGKPPSMENLRPISLTSCVGKVFEHVLANRWQEYLEEEGLYPDSMIGFRRGALKHPRCHAAAETGNHRKQNQRQ